MQTEIKTIKSAKKDHRCNWCNGLIEYEKTYMRYRWYGRDAVGTVKLHPECHTALQYFVKDEGGEVEFGMGENPRGCHGDFVSGCPECQSRWERISSA